MITFSKYKGFVGVVAALFTVNCSLLTITSCSKSLEITPMNEVVLEDYWTKEEDATKVLTACYTSLASYDCMSRMAIWGELRSDNLIKKGTVSNSVGYAVGEIFKESMQTTNVIARWYPVYQTIKNCNTFIHYAPKVSEIDPNYPESKMRANIAEATFIRDLCYFHLLRAFKEVPITFDASIDDEQEYQIAPTEFYAGLDTLIEDLQSVENDAVKRYYDVTKMDNTEMANSSDARKNTSMVTRSAIYALLADLNLWRGNWDEAIRYSDLVIDYKKQTYLDRLNYLRAEKFTDMYMFDDIPLIKESKTGSSNVGNAYTEIFGYGNSCESIFELDYQDGGISNDYVNNFYKGEGYGVSTLLTTNVTNGSNTYFTMDDCRAYENIIYSTGTSTIGKYVHNIVSINMSQYKSNSEREWPKTDSKHSDCTKVNWIFYRLTEIMLIKAEALIQKGPVNYPAAFKLINDVYKRAHNINAATGGLDATLYDETATDKTMMDLLYAERQRELMFEGKRWFDLVRRSLHEGKSTYLSESAGAKQTATIEAIKTKLLDMNFIFYPYYKEELKLNKYLQQNPSYNNTEDFVQ